MTVYIVGRIDIHDRDRYADYESGFVEIFTKYDGTFLAVDDAPLILEGDDTPHRAVLATFPDRASALRWYESDEYQQLAAIRWQASNGQIAIIEGL